MYIYLNIYLFVRLRRGRVRRPCFCAVVAVMVGAVDVVIAFAFG
jgi:hypothetical protein